MGLWSLKILSSVLLILLARKLDSMMLGNHIVPQSFGFLTYKMESTIAPTKQAILQRWLCVESSAWCLTGGSITTEIGPKSSYTYFCE